MDASDRRARLIAMREAAGVAQGDAQADTASAVGPEPALRFRNYAPAAAEHIQHEKIEPAQVADFEEVHVDVEAALGDDPEEVLLNVAPKKANWDLRRDIAEKLARLERRTQAAMIKLMQDESVKRETAGSQ